jgi:K+-sensing histidine kinase KdpD
VLAIAKFATKANFNTLGESIHEDLVAFVGQYITQVLPDFYDKLVFNFSTDGACKYEVTFKPLEVSLFIDNLVSNSSKAEAKRFSVIAKRDGQHTVLIIFDDGIGWSPELHSMNVFDKGVSTTSGSGLGLYNAKRFVQNDLNGDMQIDYTYDSGIKGKPGVKFLVIL